MLHRDAERFDFSGSTVFVRIRILHSSPYNNKREVAKLQATERELNRISVL